MDKNNYKIFAKYYDAIMDNRASETVQIEKMIKKYNPQAKTILDLGCGTGTILKYFFGRGYDVLGIDKSASMLKIAQKKLPTKNILCQNMTTFTISRRFDVVLCLFDSINHILNFADWKNLFVCVKAHLNPKGVFIFDMNTLNKLNNLTRQPTIIKKIDNGKMAMDVFLDNDVYNFEIKITTKKDDRMLKLKEIIKERSFPITLVKQNLEKIFGKVILTNQNGGTVSEHSRRVFFVCLV